MVDTRGGDRKKEASEKDECFNCGEKGHWARNCKKRRNHRTTRRSELEKNYSLIIF